MRDTFVSAQIFSKPSFSPTLPIYQAAPLAENGTTMLQGYTHQYRSLISIYLNYMNYIHPKSTVCCSHHILQGTLLPAVFKPVLGLLCYS